MVIPAEIRRKYHITKGTKVIIIDKDGKIILKPLLKEPIKEGRGRFKGGISAFEDEPGADKVEQLKGRRKGRRSPPYHGAIAHQDY